LAHVVGNDAAMSAAYFRSDDRSVRWRLLFIV